VFTYSFIEAGNLRGRGRPHPYLLTLLLNPIIIVGERVLKGRVFDPGIFWRHLVKVR